MILSRPKRVLYHDFIVTASKIYQHFISIYWAIFLFIRGGSGWQTPHDIAAAAVLQGLIQARHTDNETE